MERHSHDVELFAHMVRLGFSQAPVKHRQRSTAGSSQMFRNQMPRYEILSADAMATLDKGWRRLVTELGVEFMSQRALDLLAAAGQKVEDNNVKFDPEWILEQVAKAPREFDLQARNPANN